VADLLKRADLNLGKEGPYRGIRSVGLLSPTSGNLGNATMQSAMIANLRKRIADVEIIGITLNPLETKRRHGIEAFPLAGVSRADYGLYIAVNSETRKQSATKPSKLKQWLGKIPMLRSCWRGIRACLMELAHIRAGAKLVRKLDLIIVPGGGALDDFWGGPWGHPWTLFKWTLLSRAYGVPFLFVSIGKCSLKTPLSRFFSRVALRLARYRSYRDEGSKAEVQSLVDASNDPVYPDLAFSYHCPVVPPPHRNGSSDRRLVVGVSPIAYCDPRAWPLKDERRYGEYVRGLAELVIWLIRQEHSVLLFTTDSPDTATVNDIRAVLSSSGIDQRAIRELPSSAEQSPDGLLKAISGSDLIIASRLHGVILSHLDNIPVMALSFDRKVDAHMKAIGQEEYCLSIDDLKLETLIARFTALKAARAREQEQLNSAAQRFRDLLDRQYDQILGAPFPSLRNDVHNPSDGLPLSELAGFRAR
jgi:polysaccharide pyruvyl transferase WcaK-like protein